MKYATVIAAIAAVVSAQSACEKSAEGIPACGLGYIASAGSSIANCGIVDFQCQCSNSAAIQSAIQGTVINQCGANTGVALLNSVSSVCACATSNAGQSITLDAIESKCQSAAFAIDPCGLGYVADAAVQVGGCALYDFECQCSNAAGVISAAQANGLSSACPGTRAQNVLASAAALCQCVSGSSGGGSSGAASASASPTGASSGASATGSAASAGSGSGSSGATATKGSGSASSSGAVSMQGGSGGATSLTMFTAGAATLPAAAAGGVMAAIAGLVAYL